MLDRCVALNENEVIDAKKKFSKSYKGSIKTKFKNRITNVFEFKKEGKRYLRHIFLIPSH